MAQVVVLQIAIAEAAVRSGSSGRNIVIDPKRQIWAETSRADNRECIRSEEVGTRHKSRRRDHARWLFFVPRKIPGVSKSDRQAAGNLPRIDRARECFLLRFRTKKYWRFFNERIVVLREFESIFLESFSEVVQLRIVAVACGTGCLVFP